MEKRAERLKKEQFVKEKRLREVILPTYTTLELYISNEPSRISLITLSSSVDDLVHTFDSINRQSGVDTWALTLILSRDQASSINNVDEDSQVFLDSLQDITDSNSRSAFSSSQVVNLM